MTWAPSSKKFRFCRLCGNARLGQWTSCGGKCAGSREGARAQRCWKLPAQQGSGLPCVWMLLSKTEKRLDSWFGGMHFRPPSVRKRPPGKLLFQAVWPFFPSAGPALVLGTQDASSNQGPQVSTQHGASVISLGRKYTFSHCKKHTPATISWEGTSWKEPHLIWFSERWDAVTPGSPGRTHDNLPCHSTWQTGLKTAVSSLLPGPK